MDAIKFQVKLFSEQQDIDTEKLIPVFHNWIREKKISDELLIDVADYAHVPEGPGIVLIGHESDYYLDLAEQKPGLLYSRKRGIEGNLEARIADAFRRALGACKLLEEESDLELSFKTDQVVFRILDRLHAPNTEATKDAIEPTLRDVVAKLFGSDPKLQSIGSDRDPFTLHIETGSQASISDALANAQS